MQTNLECIAFDSVIENIIDGNKYTWEEFKKLLSVFTYAKIFCLNNDFDRFKHSWFPQSILDRYKDYNQLAAYHDCCAEQIGCILTKKNQGPNLDEIHSSGLIYDKQFYFTINFKFQFLGINTYEFEIGELNKIRKLAILKAKVIFQGLEGSEDYPQIALEIIS
jgi:hypothetical protein